ncbi:hypothetical protein WQQ_39940 [Hydrocarboniphaga effusa AP103]|uniref:Uncharacterized protein n=1 Tax=Hydrocarboniphaga effusa AP103 TaxID=1172194 RepID=I7ZAA9_9GAMM|nr:hypothetical protein WQQ_39940 [Hydrocarboniphaga effusa AP103]
MLALATERAVQNPTVVGASAQISTHLSFLIPAWATGPGPGRPTYNTHLRERKMIKKRLCS